MKNKNEIRNRRIEETAFGFFLWLEAFNVLRVTVAVAIKRKIFNKNNIFYKYLHLF